MRIKVETDQEIVTDLLVQLTETNDSDQHVRLLTDLEYYLHQVRMVSSHERVSRQLRWFTFQFDNAIVFANQGGLQRLVHLMNSTDTSTEIRQLASLALGAAFQG